MSLVIALHVKGSQLKLSHDLWNYQKNLICTYLKSKLFAANLALCVSKLSRELKQSETISICLDHIRLKIQRKKRSFHISKVFKVSSN